MLQEDRFIRQLVQGSFRAFNYIVSDIVTKTSFSNFPLAWTQISLLALRSPTARASGGSKPLRSPHAERGQGQPALQSGNNGPASRGGPSVLPRRSTGTLGLKEQITLKNIPGLDTNGRLLALLSLHSGSTSSTDPAPRIAGPKGSSREAGSASRSLDGKAS